MGKKLPIRLQDFAKIREEGFLYVDKTARIYEFAQGAVGPVLFDPGGAF
jgi:hypothetical protein